MQLSMKEKKYPKALTQKEFIIQQKYKNIKEQFPIHRELHQGTNQEEQTKIKVQKTINYSTYCATFIYKILKSRMQFQRTNNFF